MSVFEEGDIVEIIRHLDYFNRGHKGTRFTVDYVEDGFEPGDPEYGDPDYLQGPLINGWANHATAAVQASDLRLVAKAKDVDRPTRARVAAELRMDSMGDEPWFCHTETVDGDGIRVFEFTDEETGKEWYAEVRVTYVGESDL